MPPSRRKTSAGDSSSSSFFSKLGPGLVTGAADDDPSGIGTYSVAGAQFGYSPLWIAWFSFPLMAAIQLTCARLGIVSGRGLGALLGERYGRAGLWPACALLAIANVVNIGADLGGMAASTAMVTGANTYFLLFVYTALMAAGMVWFTYRRIAQVFKWMCLVLFAYVISAFLAHPDWGAVLHATALPRIELSREFTAMLVAILGTTISPYLFFWQATQEVEERREHKAEPKGERTIAVRKQRSDAPVDVATGTMFSNIIMYFIILTAAATLHSHGVTHIETTQQAAEALRPLAGQGAYLLFTLGIIGSGMLSVPVLAGSTAFAIAEGAGWRNSLTYRPAEARAFYGVLIAALVAGMLMNYAGLGVVAMLFWSAVINGLLAPPLLVFVILLSSNRDVMGTQVSSTLLRVLGWITVAVMTTAAVVFVVQAVTG